VLARHLARQKRSYRSRRRRSCGRLRHGRRHSSLGGHHENGCRRRRRTLVQPWRRRYRRWRQARAVARWCPVGRWWSCVPARCDFAPLDNFTLLREVAIALDFALFSIGECLLQRLELCLVRVGGVGVGVNARNLRLDAIRPVHELVNLLLLCTRLGVTLGLADFTRLVEVLRRAIGRWNLSFPHHGLSYGFTC